eukprot:9705-Heterococcus_DN1.PRE.3
MTLTVTPSELQDCNASTALSEHTSSSNCFAITARLTDCTAAGTGRVHQCADCPLQMTLVTASAHQLCPESMHPVPAVTHHIVICDRLLKVRLLLQLIRPLAVRGLDAVRHVHSSLPLAAAVRTLARSDTESIPAGGTPAAVTTTQALAVRPVSLSLAL